MRDADMRALASGVRHERHHRIPDNSDHQKEDSFHHYARNDESNTTKPESPKDSKLCKARFSENRVHIRCSTIRQGSCASQKNPRNSVMGCFSNRRLSMELELKRVQGNWVLTWCPKMDIMAWSWQIYFSPFTLG